jgi:hypothetical protein
MFGDHNQGIFDQYRWLLSRIQWILDGLVVVLLLISLCWLFDEPFRSRFQMLGLVTFLLTVMVFRLLIFTSSMGRQPGGFAPGFLQLIVVVAIRRCWGIPRLRNLLPKVVLAG